MTNKTLRIIVTVIAACCLMALVDTLWQPGYALRAAVKVLLFGGGLGICLPVCGGVGALRALFSPRSLRAALLLGTGVFAVILLAWCLFRGFIDLNTIAAGLLAGQQVNAGNFLWVALYISVVNSGLEELFFRGLAFTLLRSHWGERPAAIFSAAAFAAYHVSIIGAWFSWWVFTLCMAGLFVGGLIFSALDRKGSVLPSWLTHAAANLAINAIGMVMFGML